MDSKKIKILILAEKKREVYHSLFSKLSDRFSTKEMFAVENPDFPPAIISRILKLTKNLLLTEKKWNPDKIIICGGSLSSLWLAVFLTRLLRKKKEIIFFRYDIEHFWPYPKSIAKKIRHGISLMLEKYCMTNSDKIIHKGLKNELELLPFYEKINEKPHYLYRSFLNKDLVQDFSKAKKLSKSTKEIHLVYAGGLYFHDVPGTEPFWKFYPKITRQGIHFHIHSKQPKQMMDELKKIETEDKYFHYEGYLEHSELIKQLTKYDYGIHLFGDPSQEKEFLVNKVAFSNKDYDYISAGLPVLASSNLEAVKEFITENGLGMIIDYKDIPRIKSILKKNKKSYSTAIKTFIRNFKTDSLLDFVESDASN